MHTLGPGVCVPDDARGAAIALGNFDGVHIGHRAVIASARAFADEHGVPLGAALFEPHPRRFFQPDTPPFRLQSPAQRARALGDEGVKEVFEIGFDQSLAQSSDREFAEGVLRDCIGAAHVSVGAEFRFGRDRGGDVKSLKAFGAEFGFSVDAVAPVKDGRAKISSTAIRDAIANGRMDKASAMLGRPWAIEGEVQRGFARGRDFGFPTANLALADYVRPKLGVYAVRVDLDGALLPGVANVGVNPTVGALPEPVLEAHLFDFSGDLYGKTIEVELAAFLREEQKFDDVAALKAQMKQDVIDARTALTRSA